MSVARRKKDQLELLHGAAGIRLWSLQTSDSLDAILKTPNYFEDFREHGLARSDWIFCTACYDAASIEAAIVIITHIDDKSIRAAPLGAWREQPTVEEAA